MLNVLEQPALESLTLWSEWMNKLIAKKMADGLNW
jgi:hypothetical protein